MLFYITLFTIFIYFKLARVYAKEEQLNNSIIISHVFVALSMLLLINYGMHSHSLITISVISFLFFIAAALLVTTVQLGIFIDGKPLIGIRTLLKYLPHMAAVIALLSCIVALF